MKVISIAVLLIRGGSHVVSIGASVPKSTSQASPPLVSSSLSSSLWGDEGTTSRRLFKKKQHIIRQYNYLDWMDAHKIMLELAEDYPELVTLQNAQDEFGLDTAGSDDDCPADDDFNRRLLSLHNGPKTTTTPPSRLLKTKRTGCKNWYLTIQDSEAHPPSSTSSSHLPTIFISGALHGNERVGPTAALEYAALLLDASYCESLPREDYPGPDAAEIVLGEWKDGVDAARACRHDLKRRGVTDDERRWLARLVTTRRIIVVPAANALGFYRGERDEEGVDPNSDFPYDLKEGGECMRTIAARMVNEIFVNNLIQLAVNFHSGTAAVAYHWGSNSYKGFVAPDDVSLRQISEGFSRFGGELPDWGGAFYSTGSMNDLVYPVRGGMEDWAYAGSWDEKRRSKECNPSTYGKYENKVEYSSSMLRSFNILVETAVTKTPPADHLGNDFDLFNPNKRGNGHIPRNLRLTFMMTDIVQPYASIRKVNSIPISDDLVPMKRRDQRSCIKTKSLYVPSQTNIQLNWIVGGGFTIDQTAILYAKWEHLPESIDGHNQPTGDAYETLIKAIQEDEGFDDNIHISAFSNGKTRWHNDGPNPRPSSSATGLSLAATYSTSLDMTSFQHGDSVAVFAFAILDEDWGNRAEGNMLEDLTPQSHIVNARTNPEWKHENAGQILQGRIHFFSTPVTLVIGTPTQEVVEAAIRLPSSDENLFKILEENVEEDIIEHPIGTTMVFLTILFAFLGVFLYKQMMKQRRIKMFKEINMEIDGMELGTADDYTTVDHRISNHTID
mmetsp:Transcript_27615/g.33555  ORF Transcript_27615/g.33555 Transcript_27615/m.33555 type:complete len:784 (+) Transcript_27615:102-2453(+)|eukprot:CAMPEP_0172517776 /NCGR_PEP_ID=MMETSP1066-20121228/287877_1 /TAXON_ID=671091 /ORGANISM="Coscinodiscus wailesii, Strain CCMP2513" /LENGTH=783 /DNA_ID=CAMNT_0013299945 /DNA_START=97 /DNA_END=2448 /DNA_ORIENTATION=+